VVEGSPTDLPAASEPQAATPPAPPQEPEVAPEDRTPEEVEAIWKNRIAGKDRAHAAETESLRQQLASEKAARERAEQERQTQQTSEMSESDRWKAEAERERQRADAAEQQRVVDVRVAKFPAAAEHLEPSAMASMDEAKLAALDARLRDDLPVSINDPNAPRRQTPAATPPSGEKSVAELEADLKKHAPAWQESLKE